MAGLRQCLHDVTPYLIFLVTVSTLGSAQFGVHLVRHPLNVSLPIMNYELQAAIGFKFPSNKYRRQNSMPLRMLSLVIKSQFQHSTVSGQSSRLLKRRWKLPLPCSPTAFR